MKKWLTWMVLGIVCLVVFSGCASTAKSERRGLTYRVEAGSVVLDGKIRVLEAGAKKVNGLLEVQVVAANVSPRSLKFEYRFVWLDKEGVVTEIPTSDWKSLALPAKGKMVMKGKAPSPDAVKFLVSLRPGA